MSRKTALITGITGQDGSYLTDFLLKKGCSQLGVKKDHLVLTQNELTIFIMTLNNQNFIPYYGDLTDSSNILRIIQSIKPDEIYNLGTISCSYKF